MGVRIAIAEDQRMVREMLVALLSREPGLEVVGEADTGRAAIALAESASPDVLILDVGLPDMDGPAVAHRVRDIRPQTRILVASIHSDERFVKLMLESGARGYVSKSAALSELVVAIRAVVSGEIYLSPALSRPRGGVARLGERERQVLALLAEGKRSSQIAQRLRISGSTVEVHRRNIMSKLDIHSIAELTKYAVREGLTRLEPKPRRDD